MIHIIVYSWDASPKNDYSKGVLYVNSANINYGTVCVCVCGWKNLEKSTVKMINYVVYLSYIIDNIKFVISYQKCKKKLASYVPNPYNAMLLTV